LARGLVGAFVMADGGVNLATGQHAVTVGGGTVTTSAFGRTRQYVGKFDDAVAVPGPWGADVMAVTAVGSFTLGMGTPRFLLGIHASNSDGLCLYVHSGDVLAFGSWNDRGDANFPIPVV